MMISNEGALLVKPDWPAHERIRAFSTTRIGGVSEAPYESLNLAGHVGDDPATVRRNRAVLAVAADLPAEPRWLTQVHGGDVVCFDEITDCTQADACFTSECNQVCAVMTADCLPVLLTNRDGTRVAAAHAGWRGLAGGAIENAVARLQCAHGELLAWLGPAIGPQAFEVGDDVLRSLQRVDAQLAHAFQPAAATGKYLLDIYHAARIILHGAGVDKVYGGGLCTWSDAEHFFSYRRDGVTGRMATLIWITA